MNQRSPEAPRPDSLDLLIVDSDPVFRLGLRTCLQAYPDLQIRAEASHATEAMTALANLLEPPLPGPAPLADLTQPPGGIDLVILDLELEDGGANQGRLLCQELKRQYPTLPLLLLTTQRQISLLAELWQLGVDGYCPKGIEVAALVDILRRVAAGEAAWNPVLVERLQTYLRQEVAVTGVPPTRGWQDWRSRLWEEGRQEMETTLARLETQLQQPGLTWWQRELLAGQRREIRAAHWLVRRLLLPVAEPEVGSRPIVTLRPRSQPEPTERSRSLPVLVTPTAELPAPPEELEAKFMALKSLLLETTLAKLHHGLVNLTGEPLEMDCLKPEKRQELFAIVLRRLEEMLDELRFAQVTPTQLLAKRSQILVDLWQATTMDFFGRYTTLHLAGTPQGPITQQVEIVSLLLKDQAIVESEILAKIPLVVELLAHLIFQAPLVVDNAAYPPGAPAAVYQATALLENLALQVANGVIQPLLNRLPDVEVIKQNFYDRRVISTREIERFRNALSWKYRLGRLLREPQDIFASQYHLLVLGDRGIKKISIYAPRRQELEQLRGWPLAVTLALEARDAIAPPLRSTVAWLGQGLVYVLTQVIGRGIGLIGRGILQGIGSSWQDIRYNRKSPEQK